VSVTYEYVAAARASRSRGGTRRRACWLRGPSDAALKQLLRQSDRPAFFLAQVYAFRDEIDAALSSLDRGYAGKDPGIILLKSEVPSSLESDPRYKAFLRKVKLPES
jgi:hypothetical protein